MAEKVSIDSIYKIYNNILTPQECKDIIDIFPTLDIKPAGIYGDKDVDKQTGRVDHTQRKGKVAFAISSEIPHWSKILSAINHFNLTQGLNLNGMFDIQLAKYEAGDHFIKHQDTSAKQFSRMADGDNTRKISASVQLSPEEDYTGGEFVMMTEKTNEGSNGHVVSKDVGTMVLFPSYCEHMVSEIKSGTRYSLVIWAKGPYWR